MIEAKEAQAAFERLRFTLRSSDSDIIMVSKYFDQQVVRDAREGTDIAYMNREQEIIAGIKKRFL